MTEAAWYRVDKYGTAVKCASREAAENLAVIDKKGCPARAPYHVALMVTLPTELFVESEPTQGQLL